MRRLVAALACRVGGSRLYGKPLQNLDVGTQKTVLDYMLDALSTVPVIDAIVLGVSEGVENEPFHEIARRRGISSIAGNETDVLERLIRCGEVASATDIFRVTTESPFVHYDAIADAWERHCATESDFTTIAGLPDGCTFEIIRLDALQRSHREGSMRHRSELCSLYIQEHPDSFRIKVWDAPEELRRRTRLTIDYPEDLVLCRAIFENLREAAPRIPLGSILEFLDANPRLGALIERYIH
jgi:spore coat polysaccharide biosynthesis protein SpsF